MCDKETWFLLYEGESVDGRGTPHYVGRTTDINVARLHMGKTRDNPYRLDCVKIITDKFERMATVKDF